MRISQKLCYFGIFMTGILILNVSVHSEVFYVGSGEYTSIQSAVDATQHGDTVVVPPGIYYENVVITTSDLLLISEEFQTTGGTTKNTTLINADGAENAVEIRANGVVIRGLTLHNYTVGVYVENCSAVIDHCIIHNTGVTGVNPRGIQVFLEQSSQAFVEITNNKIFSNVKGGNWLDSGGRGINVFSDKAGDLCTVLIDNNTIYENDQRGISVAHISAEITNNFLAQNGVHYKNRLYNVGILLYFNKGYVLVENNEIFDVEPGNAVFAGGIYLFADIDYGYEPGYYGTITIQGNVIDTESCAPGINLNSPNKETFDIFLIGNTISGTTIIPWSGEELGGLYAGNMNPTYIGYVDVIEENTLIDNNIGLFVRRTDVGSIKDNNIYNNKNYGLFYHKKATQVSLDATSNWWGDESGPGGGVYDPLTGTLAQGSGDSISENIHFDPWLQAPYSEFHKIDIDIKPGSYPNSVNVNSKGRIPVAVMTNSYFDAANVYLDSLRFGKTGSEAIPVHSAMEDVDGDGDLDLILHFETKNTGLQCGDTKAYLRSQTLSGHKLEGSDSIKTIGCK